MRYCYFGLLLLFASCQSPKAIFDIIQKEKSAPATVSFDNQSIKALSYFWDFGDGHTSEELNPTHKYILSGKYLVTLNAINNGKSVSLKKEIIIEPPHHCMVEIQTTEGNMTAILYDDTPLHRDNFLKLVEEGFYNGILFHRVIKGFMAQTGDPESKTAHSGKELGGGGPAYKIKAEIKDTLVHVKGALAAARMSDQVNPKKESSGSQFYIVQGKPATIEQLENYELQKNIKYSTKDRETLIQHGGAPQLDMEYTVFGQVIKGLDIIDAIAGQPTDKRDRPLQDVKIVSIKIIK
ncbi:MAG: peptidylprolyl isomerase [Saprospiraceae bacterium]|nr:peptidylprolyl isomerase [Saprospiraceae bacterium]